MNKKIYLDYASTTPVSKNVFKKMKPYFTDVFFNASSIHKGGLIAKKAVQDSREKIARILSVRSQDVYFVGSGTESINLAILGVVRKFLNDEKLYKQLNGEKPHMIITSIEHPAVVEAARRLEIEGAELTVVPVLQNGLVEPQKLRAALKPNTVLVSVMFANNEIGTVLPISKISREIQEYKKKIGREKNEFPFFHTDASQAVNYFSVQVEKLGVDLMTIDAGKFYGPKGVGVLYKKHSVPIESIIFGGSQEEGLRAGTENVAGIVGCAEAFVEAQKIREKESNRIIHLQLYFMEEVLKLFPNAILNGDLRQRLPNNVNFCFPESNAEFLVLALDAKGVAVSSTTACKSLGDNSYSYVVEALGRPECAASSIRFSFGRDTTKNELKKVVKILEKIKLDFKL
jgi:cysteine desulfurase